MRIALVSAAAFLVLHPATSVADAPEVYERLKSLAGEWEAELPGFGKLTSTVRVVSKGRAIEEFIGTPEDSELSVYSLNVDRILLTHYCAMTPDGHQVRLETPRLGAAADRLDFGLSSATNLHSKAAAHMRRVVMTLSDPDHYTERWTKRENGKDTVFELKFVRTPHAGS